MKKLLKTSLTALLFFIGISLTYSQNAQWETYYTYTTGSNDLLDNDINDMVEHNGTIWIATGRGIIEFDGTNWYRHHSYSKIESNLVLDIEVDNSGNIWFAGHGGATKYDGNKWTKFTSYNSGMPGPNVTSVVADGSGNLWFGTDKGLGKFDGTNWTTYTTSNGLKSNEVRSLFVDKSNNIWIGHEWLGQGITKYDGSTFTTYTTSDGLPANNVYTITEDSGGAIWVATECGGVGKFNGSTWTTYNSSNTSGKMIDCVREIMIDGSDVWIGTIREGLVKYDGSNWTKYTTSDGLVSNFIKKLLKVNNKLWIGTQEGYSIYDSNTFKNVSTRDGNGVICNELMDVFVSSNKDVYFGTVNGLSIYSKGTWSSVSYADGIWSNSIRDIEEDKNGNIWIGTGWSAYQYVNGSWKEYNTWNGLVGAAVNRMLKDSKGNLWIGTNVGISVYNGSSFTNYTTSNGLPSNDILELFEDANGHIWIGTPNGVCEYNGSSFVKTYTTSDGLSDNRIIAISQDKKGQMWFGSWGNGIDVIKDSSLTHYTTKDGLGSNNISRIFKAPNGDLYISNPWEFVTIYDGKSFTKLNAPGDNRDVRGIGFVDQNNIWYGTYFGIYNQQFFNYDAEIIPNPTVQGSIIPKKQVAAGIEFKSNIINNGKKGLTQLNLTVDVNDGEFYGGSQLPYLPAGKETLYQIPNKYYPGKVKEFKINYNLTVRENDEFTGNNTYTLNVKVNDSIYARDNNTIHEREHVVLSNNNNAGNVFSLASSDTLTSVSVYMHKHPTGIGAKFNISIYKDVDLDNKVVGDILFTSETYTVTSTMFDNWSTVHFNGTGVYMQPGSYLITINSIDNEIYMGKDSTIYGNHLAVNSGKVQKSQHFLLLRANFGNGATKLAYPPYRTLDINNIKAGFNANGQMFNYAGGTPRFEVPNGSGNHTIYASNLWVGGLDKSDKLHAAAQQYNINGSDYWPGPIASSYDDKYDARYNRVWFVSKADIAYHMANYQNANYEVIPDIAEWPAHGNTSNGESFYLAPFVDLNSNGIYEPEAGEYPEIRGDQAIYFIYNDARDYHAESKGEKLGIELHCMAYAYDMPDDSLLNNTIFMNVSVKNRSNNDYHDVYVGLWSDMDIGTYDDDYVGCDTSLNSYYFYNAKSPDGDYGNHPPAQAATFLSSRMSSFVYYNNTNGTPTSNPDSSHQVYNYLTGKWRDGTPITEGGNGYGGTKSTNFMYTGDPYTKTGWSEVSENNTAGDRRGLGVIGPFDLKDKENLCIDVAFPNAIHYAGNHLNSVNLLKQRVKQLHSFYNSQAWTCSSDILLRTETKITNADCKQSNGSVIVKVSGGVPPYTYAWSNGDTTSSATNLAAGSYTLNISDNDNHAITKTIIINDKNGPTIQIDSVKPVSCYGLSDGFVNISVSGGTSPYKYYWSNKSRNDDISNLTASSYLVVVTDDKGCKSIKYTTVNEPDPLNMFVNKSNSQCGKSNGYASVNPIGGTSPYTYDWSNGKNTHQINNLAFGTYSITIKDVNKCAITKNVAISETGGPIVTLDTIIEPLCGEKNGAIYITTTGGTGYYDYSWSNGTDLEDLTKVESGNYTITITDYNTCRGLANFDIKSSKPDPDPICLVTVDNAGKNLIAWERKNSKPISHWNIYRESLQSGIYQKIGTRAYKDLTVFVDTLSDPYERSWRYKLSVVDKCNQESSLSPLHKTIHLTANKGLGGEANLIWNHYEGFPFYTYHIYRGTTPSNIQYLTSIQSNLNSYTDYNPPSGVAYYMVSSVKLDTCYPSKSLRAANNSGPFSQSLSNLKDYGSATMNYLHVSHYEETIENDNGSSAIFQIYTNAPDWSAHTDEDWLVVYQNNYESNITVEASENIDNNPRTGYITLKATGVDDITLKVIQTGVSGIVDQIIKDVQVLIYPNPVKDQLVIEFLEPVNDNTHVYLYDMPGRLIESTKIIEDLKGTYRLNTSSIPKGTYILKIIGTNINLSKKIIKN